ncbi:uncharacterized protein LOC126681008 [Mercurialis annua]|uniref:uncharacterized protein LOC126681008 n=1 Tax=Mercurialis annua TaxID=3986 RepID=UPI0024ACB91D|nr:uncharacterized protein LOC126681008 [Mercurialis annua]
MKREGRQHGMVRTCRILPSPFNPSPHTRFINRLDSPPTAGLFTKVRPRPTNHSKFTGKCGKPRCNECHMNPSSKSKDKTKGTHKIKSGDGLSNFKFMSGSSAAIDEVYYYDRLETEIDRNTACCSSYRDEEEEDGDLNYHDEVEIDRITDCLVFDEVEIELEDEDWCMVAKL